MLKFIDDLAGAIRDLFKDIFTAICYLLAGGLIVAVPVYIILFIFDAFS